jgi:DNA-binding MarR family transcriptional regulator
MQFAQGLNPAQWEALRYLGRANRFSRTPTALAEYLRTTKGTVSQTLKALEAKGYVKRAPVPKDRRAVRLDITDSGHAVLRRDPLLEFESAAARLGSAELASAKAALMRLVANLESPAGPRGFGLCQDCTHFCKNAAVDANDPHRCALEREALSAEDAIKICVNHSAA